MEFNHTRNVQDIKWREFGEIYEITMITITKSHGEKDGDVEYIKNNA